MGIEFSQLKQLDEYRWLVPRSLKPGMRTDALIYADRALLEQIVRDLSIEQAMRTPEYGAPLVVLGAPLTIDADSFKTASGNLADKLRLICDRVHAYGHAAIM